jgi:hypothetical protein
MDLVPGFGCWEKFERLQAKSDLVAGDRGVLQAGACRSYKYGSGLAARSGPGRDRLRNGENVSVRLDVRSNIDKVLANVKAERANISTATVRALNRALDSSNTETSREIRKVYNLKDRAVKAALRKIRASKSRLWAELRIEGSRIGLIEFDARWRQGQKVGATVQVKIGGGRKTVAGAFIAAGRGGQNVFRRVGNRRFPIRRLTSVSIPQAFDNESVTTAVQRIAAAVFDKNFEQQIVFLRGLNG